MMKKLNYLEGCHICVSVVADQSMDDICRSIQQAGGVMSTSITDDTTHLIVSKEEYTSRSASVKTLRKDDIRIVAYDWLERSVSNSCMEKEAPFMWEAIMAARSRPKRASERTFLTQALAQHVSELQMSGTVPGQGLVSDVNSLVTDETSAGEKYLVYKDSTGFEFDMRLTKTDAAMNEHASIRLAIFEIKHTNPPAYIAFSQPTDGIRIQANRLAVIGSNLPTAMSQFKKHFEKHTRISWDRRGEQDAAAGNMPELGRTRFMDRPFIYDPPADRQPATRSTFIVGNGSPLPASKSAKAPKRPPGRIYQHEPPTAILPNSSTQLSHAKAKFRAVGRASKTAGKEEAPIVISSSEEDDSSC